ncbi:MAG: hypothetical protein IPK75_20355 [Acidobacteria bacterium]|nr:hypothetical protein [Acidobacteriota bacterium]
MVSHKDFTDTSGQTDWTAYNLARQLAGEICTRCKHPRTDQSGVAGLCFACTTMDRFTDGLVLHPRRVRCHHCGHQNTPDRFDDPGVYTAGVHKLTCADCGRETPYETHVHYSFESPALLATKKPATKRTET